MENQFSTVMLILGQLHSLPLLFLERSPSPASDQGTSRWECFWYCFRKDGLLPWSQFPCKARSFWPTAVLLEGRKVAPTAINASIEPQRLRCSSS